LRDRQLIAGTFRFRNGLRLLRNSLLDRGRKSRLADESELLDSYSYRLNLGLYAIAGFTQEPRLFSP
jgi:hypothetical protein